MKLKYSRSMGWQLVAEGRQVNLNCGQQVQIQCRDTTGKIFWVCGRFEIAGPNNPVFYTTFGRVSPDLNTTLFEL